MGIYSDNKYNCAIIITNEPYLVDGSTFVYRITQVTVRRTFDGEGRLSAFEPHKEIVCTKCLGKKQHFHFIKVYRYCQLLACAQEIFCETN